MHCSVRGIASPVARAEGVYVWGRARVTIMFVLQMQCPAKMVCFITMDFCLKQTWMDDYE